MEFPLYRGFPGAASSAQVFAQIYSMTGGRPNELIGSSGVATISSFYPAWNTIDLTPLNIVLNTPAPFMVALKYEAGTVGSTPSILTDSTDGIPEGKNFYSEDGGTTWREHYDFWQIPHQVGYNMIRAMVRTQEGDFLTLQGMPGAMVTELRSNQGAEKPLIEQDRR